MPGLIVFGNEIEVPGLKILNWRDDKRLVRSREDGGNRKSKWVKQIIVHTTKGIPGGKDNRPQHVIPGAGPDLGKEFATARYWASDPKCSGAHLIIDVDGSIGCIADLGSEYMNHAANRGVNQTSIGIEMYQMSDAGIYQATLDACIKLVDALTEIFGIQRQVHLPYLKGPVKRLSKGGKDCVGVFGHRDVSGNRGLGDPGDIIMNMLVEHGYEKFNFEKGEDLLAWKIRQDGLRVDIDGIPGPGTVKALKDTFHKAGLWVGGKVSGVEEPSPTQPVALPPQQEVKEEDKSAVNKLLDFLKRLFGG